MTRLARAVAFGVLMLVAAAHPAAAETSGVVALTSKVALAPGATATAVLLVTPSAGAVLVTAEGSDVEVALGGCDSSATFGPSVDLEAAPAGGPAREVDLCIHALGTQATRVVAIGADGSSAAIPVTITSAAAVSPPTPPSAMKVVTQESTRQVAITPGFAVPSELRTIANGADDSSLVALSPGVISCDTARDPDSTTTTAASDAGSAVAHLAVCDAGKVGEYTATFDLNGATEGGALIVTVVRRQPMTLAAVAVAAGILVAVLVDLLTRFAQGRAAKSAREKAQTDANELFTQVAAELRSASEEVAEGVDSWSPTHWSPLTDGTRPGEATTPRDAATLYGRSARAVPDLLALWRHYQNPAHRVGLEPPFKLPASVLEDLRFGIVLHNEGDTIAKVTDRLERHGYLARHTVRRDLELLREINRESGDRLEALRRERRALAAAGLDEVDEVPVALLGNIPVTPGPRISRVSEYASLGVDFVVPRPAGAPTPALALPTPDQPNPVRSALESRTAQVVAVALGLVVALAVGAKEALNPTAAWGTPGDLATMFGAAATIPALLDQARKLGATKSS